MPEFKNPAVAASVCVFAKKENAVLMIRRLKEPFKDAYAFPGGFMDTDNEDIYDTAVRELAEETGIKVRKQDLQLIGIGSAPKRDPRGHVLDIRFMAVIDKTLVLPKEADEAPVWVPMDKVSNLQLAFDHSEYWAQVKTHLTKQYK
jgi:8-oxo-dGTP diphosphatase